jgi:hypothetical protein
LKKIMLLGVCAAALMLAVAALPAGAGPTDPTGARLNLLSSQEVSSRSILANVPFHVKHGFRTVAGDSSPQEIQTSLVSLAVDGVAQRGVVLQEFSDTKPRVLTGKFYLFNFPNGLPLNTTLQTPYVMVLKFTFKGEVTLTRTVNVYVMSDCEYGVQADGLQCQGPPA